MTICQDSKCQKRGRDCTLLTSMLQGRIILTIGLVMTAI
jgi:hypothetical protein